MNLSFLCNPLSCITLLSMCIFSPTFAADKPNILVIWGDDVGFWNISANSRGVMGYKTPNIDRIANEGMGFSDYYGEQSCTAGLRDREIHLQGIR